MLTVQATSHLEHLDLLASRKVADFDSYLPPGLSRHELNLIAMITVQATSHLEQLDLLASRKVADPVSYLPPG